MNSKLVLRFMDRKTGFSLFNFEGPVASGSMIRIARSAMQQAAERRAKPFPNRSAAEQAAVKWELRLEPQSIRESDTRLLKGMGV